MLYEIQEWQPIETAPKDGTHVLLWFANGGMVIAPSVEPVRLTKEETKQLVKAGTWPNYREYQPTHWMPLPPPPIERKEDEQLSGIAEQAREHDRSTAALNGRAAVESWKAEISRLHAENEHREKLIQSAWAETKRLRAALEKISFASGDQPAAMNIPPEDWYRSCFYDCVATASAALGNSGEK